MEQNRMIKKELHLVKDIDGELRLGQSLNTSYRLSGKEAHIVECLLALRQCEEWDELPKKFSSRTSPTLSELLDFIETHKDIPIWKSGGSNNRCQLYINQLNSNCDFAKEVSGIHVLIIGVGGVGSTVAIQLAKLGVRDFTLIDDDKVEDVNLFKCIAYDIEDVGEFKVCALGKKIANINPQASVKLIKSKLTDLRIKDGGISVGKNSIVVQCGDKRARSILGIIKENCNDADIPILTAGCFEQYVIAGPNIFSSEVSGYESKLQHKLHDNDEISRYNESVLNVGTTSSVAFAASLIVNEVLNYISTQRLSLHLRQLMWHLPTMTLTDATL